ncbi:MAG: hypothetical protein ABSF70_05070 [Terracidiphilus sp.]|jgi:hypothetical protein
MRKKEMIWVGIVSVVSVTLLTILLMKTMSEWFFYPLFIGMACYLLIAGGICGGTHTEEFVGTVLGIIVNSIVYFAVIELFIRLRRKISRSHS